MIVPVESAGEDSATLVAETAPGTAERRTSGRAIRLLVVDDHHIVREGFAAMLDHQSDFEVVGEAADGRQAIEQAELLQPDAIVMDVEMPHLNGIEATRQIKARWPDTVIVGLSLHDDEATHRIMTEAGAAEHINKRAPGKDLIESLRRACRRELSSEGPQES
jgi:two-component system response regulator NreC